VSDLSHLDPGIATVSPSLYSRLSSCQYRVFLDRSRPPRSAAGFASTAAVLGTVGHLALQRLVESGALRATDLSMAARSAWEEAISEVVGSLTAATALPGYYLKAARFANTATRLQRLVGPASALVPEVELRSPDGVIVGRADLIAHGSFGSWIVDYKSGVEREPGTGVALICDHENQLRLYAYLWASTHGEWPASTYLLPFDGPEIEVPVDPRVCEAVANRARDLRAEFNACVPDPPPASPAPDHCRFCPHLGECEPFQAACDATWAPDLLSLIGTVVSSERSARGGRSLLVDVDGGSISPGRVAVTHVGDATRDAARALPGARVVIVGLFAGPTSSAFGLRESGSVSVLTDA
jgi:CRISPR/Cas system-associated exonuclease Cas4 (RecB family)